MREIAPTRATPGDFWTVNQAAEALNVHRRFIERRMYDGTLTVYKLSNRSVRLDADEVRALAVPVSPTGGRR